MSTSLWSDHISHSLVDGYLPRNTFYRQLFGNKIGHGIKGDKNSTSMSSSKSNMIDRMQAQMQAHMAAKAAATGFLTMPKLSGACANSPHDRKLLSSSVLSNHSATCSWHHLMPLSQSFHQVKGTAFPHDKEPLSGRSSHLGNFFPPSHHYGESPTDQSAHTPLQGLPHHLICCQPSIVLTNDASMSSLQHHTPP